MGQSNNALEHASTLHPRFQRPEVLAELGERWFADGRRLRISEVLAPGFAEAVADAALAQPFEFFEKHVDEVHAVLWRYAHRYARASAQNAADPLVRVQQLFQRDLPALASAITGQALHRVDDDVLVFDLYSKGSYLDVHTDHGANRRIAYVLGLTRDQWPAEAGGQLQFMNADGSEVIDGLSPGFDTLDMFCIYPLLRPHRVSLLHQPVTRLSVNGWFSGALKGPLED